MTLFTRDGTPMLATARRGNKMIAIRDRACVRCGGLGGSEKWRHTGWTCLRCSGNRIDPERETVKLYTVEQLEKMNARKVIADAKRAAVKAEKDRVEAERVAAEKAEIISSNDGFIQRIREELVHGESEILSSVIDRMFDHAKDPTDRQVEVVNRIIDDRQAERKRLLGAAHVGEIGKRLDWELTLLFTRSTKTDAYPYFWSHWSLFTDALGRKVACTSAPWIIGLVHTEDEGYVRGQMVKVKATVTKHEFDKKAEPVTYINRPKPL